MSDGEPLGPEERRRYDEELTGYRPNDEMGRGSCLATFLLWAVVVAIMLGVMTWAAVRAA